MGEDKKRGRHTDLLVIVLSVVSCLGVVGTAGYYVLTYSREAEARITPEPLVVEGDVKARTLNDPEKRQQELSSVVEGGMMMFFINATPFMTGREGEASLVVENPPNNGKRFTITIQRNSTEEVIYKSGCLDPERYIDEILLDAGLPRGGYACTAYFGAYRLNDDDYIGRVEAQVTLYVLE